MPTDRSTSDRLSRIEAVQEGMANDVAEIKREIHSVTESALPRAEANARIAEGDRRLADLNAALASRLEIREYQVAHEALIQRVARLENAPQRQLGWIALGVSSLGCLVTAIGVFFTAIAGAGAIIINYVHK